MQPPHDSSNPADLSVWVAMMVQWGLRDDRNRVAVRVEVSIPSGDWVLDTWRKRDERVLKKQPSRAVQQMHRWQLESELMLKRQEVNKLLRRMSKYEDDEGNPKEAAK
jgi:hypothetical protein